MGWGHPKRRKTTIRLQVATTQKTSILKLQMFVPETFCSDTEEQSLREVQSLAKIIIVLNHLARYTYNYTIKTYHKTKHYNTDFQGSTSGALLLSSSRM